MGMYDFVFVYQRENKYLSRQVKALPQTNLSPKSPLTRGRQMKKAGRAQNAKRRVFESFTYSVHTPQTPQTKRYCPFASQASASSSSTFFAQPPLIYQDPRASTLAI